MRRDESPSGQLNWDAAAETMAEKGEESSMDLLNDFQEMPALDFLSDSFISGAQLADLWADLPPAEGQLVDEFLKDTDLSDVAPYSLTGAGGGGESAVLRLSRVRKGRRVVN